LSARAKKGKTNLVTLIVSPLWWLRNVKCTFAL